MPVLSPVDLEFFEENGYVVVKSVISKDQAAATARRVWTYANQDPDDPETWYGKGGIMIEMYQSQEQWDNRQAPKIHEAFSQIWGQEELRVSRDRASINPPALDMAAALDSQVAFGLHFDTGFAQKTVSEAKQERPIPRGVQGVLYLVDTPESNGAFICVPGMHRQVNAWLDTLPEDAKPNQMLQLKHEGAAQSVLLGAKTKRIPAEAGDLIIWDTRLPHSAASNVGDAPRVAQYITMNPAGPLTAEDIASNTAWWAERHAGFGAPRNREHYSLPKPATLTQLGRRLAGVEPWPKYAAESGSAASAAASAKL